MYWAMSVIVLGIGCFVLVLNWAIVYRVYVKNQHSSWVPLVGGLMASVGLSTLPVRGADTF